MKNNQKKQSIYQIEPWNEEPSTIPQCFLKTNSFAKTILCPKSSFKPQPNLQITTNSVFFIKNHQQQSLIKAKAKTKYHRTAQSSPRLVKKFDEQSLKQNAIRKKMLTSTQSTVKSKVGSQSVPVFQHTKNVIFELKTIKKKGMEGKRRANLFLQDKNALHQNLLKIYQKSTLANEQKKLRKLSKMEIDEICFKRKLKNGLKTQFNTNEFLISQVSSQSSPFQSKQKNRNQTIDSGKGNSLQREKVPKPQINPKLQFELLLERKLFLLKNNRTKGESSFKTTSFSQNQK